MLETKQASANILTGDQKSRMSSNGNLTTASVLFDLDKAEVLGDMLLNAAREGDSERLNAILHRYRHDPVASFDLNIRDLRGFGNTAVHLAAKRGHGQVVLLLLQCGVDTTLQNYEGQTALDLGSSAIRRMILESLDKPPSTSFSYRALLQSAWQGGFSKLHCLFGQAPRPLDVGFTNSDGLTALLLATRDLVPFERLVDQLRFDHQPINTVRELLTHPYDIYACDSLGKTALHYSSSTPAKSSKAIVELLLDKGTSLTVQDSCGYTAVHCAARCGNIPVLRLLIERGASVNERGSAGSTPLHLSAMEGREGAVDVLLKSGADPRAVDDGGHTPIDLAKTRRIKFIIEGKSPPEIQITGLESKCLSRSQPSLRKNSGGQIPQRLCRALSFANVQEIQSSNFDRSSSNRQFAPTVSPVSPSIPSTRHGRVNFPIVKNFRETSVFDIERSTPSASSSRPNSGSLSSRSWQSLLFRSSTSLSSKIFLPSVSFASQISQYGDTGINVSSSTMFTKRGKGDSGTKKPQSSLMSHSPLTSNEYASEDTCTDVLFKGRTSSKTFIEDIEDMPSAVVPSYPATPFLMSEELKTIHESNEENMSLRSNNPLKETQFFVPEDTPVPKTVVISDKSKSEDVQTVPVKLFEETNSAVPVKSCSNNAFEEKSSDKGAKAQPITKSKVFPKVPNSKGKTTQIGLPMTKVVKPEKDCIVIHQDIADLIKEPETKPEKLGSSQTGKQREKSFVAYNQPKKPGQTVVQSANNQFKPRPKIASAKSNINSKGQVGSSASSNNSANVKPSATTAKIKPATKGKGSSGKRKVALTTKKVQKKSEPERLTEIVESDLPEENVDTFHVFISGQGWQLSTPCNEPVNIPERIHRYNEVSGDMSENTHCGEIVEPLAKGLDRVANHLDITSAALANFPDDRLNCLLNEDTRSSSPTLVPSDDEIPEELDYYDDFSLCSSEASTNPDFMRRVEATSFSELKGKLSTSTTRLMHEVADQQPTNSDAYDPNSWNSSDDYVFLRSGEWTDRTQRHSVPNWKRGNLLGRGSYGVVWCGMTDNGQLIAVKEIKFDSEAEETKQEFIKIQEEIDILKTLKHRNIVHYLGTSMTKESVNIFMEFVPGGSLATLLARFGPFAERVFRRYTRQIVEGVSFLHSNAVIHRDIKGANVMLMPNGVVKLIDFGCAKRLQTMGLSHSGSLQQQKSLQGSPYWMAPEVILETGHGKKSDVWSLGCTVFEMATSKPPWGHLQRYAAVFAIGSGEGGTPCLDPKDYSIEACNFVTRCMVRDASQRPTAEQLSTDPFIAARKSFPVGIE